MISRHALAAGILALSATSIPIPVQAYPVDCAILLCLAGGWPPSAECAQAYGVFIARITPWPIEPPLQIWNCPMHADFRRVSPLEQLRDIAFRPSALPLQSVPKPPLPTPIPVTDEADIDISDPAYDFVRSIRVFQIDYHQHRDSEGECHRTDDLQLGTYGEQGDFSWAPSPVATMPTASSFDRPSGCDTYQYRSVFVDWQDYEGTYGFEEVRY